MVYESLQPQQNNDMCTVLQSIGLSLNNSVIWKDGILLVHSSSEYTAKQLNPLSFQWSESMSANEQQVVHLTLNGDCEFETVEGEVLKVPFDCEGSY